jgi:hypothetical protein
MPLCVVMRRIAFAGIGNGIRVDHDNIDQYVPP